MIYFLGQRMFDNDFVAASLVVCRIGESGVTSEDMFLISRDGREAHKIVGSE